MPILQWYTLTSSVHKSFIHLKYHLAFPWLALCQYEEWKEDGTNYCNHNVDIGSCIKPDLIKWSTFDIVFSLVLNHGASFVVDKQILFTEIPGWCASIYDRHFILIRTE